VDVVVYSVAGAKSSLPLNGSQSVEKVVDIGGRRQCGEGVDLDWGCVRRHYVCWRTAPLRTSGCPSHSHGSRTPDTYTFVTPETGETGENVNHGSRTPDRCVLHQAIARGSSTRLQ